MIFINPGCCRDKDGENLAQILQKNRQLQKITCEKCAG